MRGYTVLRLTEDRWVYSSLQKTTDLANHNYYKVDPSKQMQGSTWQIGYQDG